MRILFMLFAVVLSSGCATVFSGPTSKVTFKSEPPGATVRVYNRVNNKLFEGVTPCQGTLRSTRFSYTADFDMEGHHTCTEAFSGSLNPWLLGDVIVPVLGLPIGLFFDFGFGSAFRLPKEVSCTMQVGKSAGKPYVRPE